MDLRTYIETDPDNLGFAPLIAAGNDGGIADLINAKGKTKTQEINSYIPYRYLVKRLVWRAIEAASKDATHPAHIPATVAVDLIAAGGDMPVDLADPDALPMFGGLVATGLLKQQHQDELIAMCLVPASYGEAAGLKACMNNLDIAVALGRNGFGG